MAEREAAKAAELTAAGQPTSAVTVRRMSAWSLPDRGAS